MSDIKVAYATAAAFTITMASLADSGTVGRESLSVDNASTKYLDALVTGKIKTQNSGAISAPSAVFVYVYGSIDGTTFPDTVTGADSAITINNPTQLKLLGAIYAAAINTTYKGGPWSVASLFGGRMPMEWGIVVVNDCGTALSSTEGDHGFSYQGVYNTLT